MDKHIKDTFNQVHAPKNLIEDTKKKMLEASKNETHIIKKKNHHWKAVTAITSLAACAMILVIGKQFFQNDIDSNPNKDMVDITDFSQGKDSFNADDKSSIKEFEFEGTKGLSDWYKVLENIDTNINESVNLDENYVIYTAKYPKGDIEYQIDLLVERGELYRENDRLILRGNFKAKIYESDKLLQESDLNIDSTSQFTTKDAVVKMQDRNQDNSMDFLLETACEQGQESTEEWFTLDGNLSVVKCE